jgi:hypothetical protein
MRFRHFLFFFFPFFFFVLFLDKSFEKKKEKNSNKRRKMGVCVRLDWGGADAGIRTLSSSPLTLPEVQAKAGCPEPQAGPRPATAP